MSKGKDTKPHIGIFGRRNYGKSTLINVITGQDIAIVSDTAGTTTDPVKKTVEIKGIGPVILVDTAGIDDSGDLGEKRVQKSKNALRTIDLAILVIADNKFEETEITLTEEFEKFDIPFVIIHNKTDLQEPDQALKDTIFNLTKKEILSFSSLFPQNLNKLLNFIKESIPESAYKATSLLGDVLQYGDIVLLITPIDNEAPEGRLILPQVQTIRDILDNDCIAIVLKEREVDAFLKKTGIKPTLAVTDSSIFLKADASIPKEIPLTGFSVLLAKHKGNFNDYLKGTPKIAGLKDGDRVLMLESCTHQVSCDDIGRVKIPRWLSSFTGKKLEYEVVTGLDDLKRPITDYAMVIQCGGCVVTRKQLSNRLKPAIDAGVPVTNYGMAIAYIQGIYNRAIEIFTTGDDVGDSYL